MIIRVVGAMPRNVIFYFSGTGNSLAVAQMLSEKLSDTIMIPLLSVRPSFEMPDEVESVGIVYPIYMNAVPKIVKEFISKMKLKDSCYFYGVATHGGLPGNAGCYLLKTAKDNKIELKGYFEIKMINNTPKGVAPKPLMRLNWEKEISEDLIANMVKQVESDMPYIVSSIQARDSQSVNLLQRKSRRFGYQFTKLLWKISEGSNPKLEFLLDKECTGCGTCEKVCSTGRIKITDGHPIWEQGNCCYCYACFNFCPVQAITVKHYEKKLGRYHHPNITWSNIAAQKTEANL